MNSTTATTTHKRIVEQANEAFVRNDIEAFFSLCTEDLEWTIVGDRTVTGKAAIREWMTSMDPGAPKISVDQIIAEGDVAAATGGLWMKDKDGREAQFAWCDLYRFQGDRIAGLKAFIIKTGA
jgi:ketosteroid isomerase-like protein